MNPYISYYQNHEEQIFKDYFAFLRFASITTDPRHQKEVRECAAWVAEYCSCMGLYTQLWETKKAPIVFATHGGENKPTLMIYAHYDVQPVDPIELWYSPPFEPVIRNQDVYARGAVDDKGQCMYALAALQAVKEIKGNFPMNIKVLIEGEEESGSGGLTKILEEKKEALKADYLLIVDSGFRKLEEPAICLGARGIVALTITCVTANTDMHSGLLGGVVYNPNRILATIISQLYNGSGRVAIPGFYDDLVDLSASEKEEFDFSFDSLEMKRLFGAEPLGVEKGVSPGEAVSIRPTLEINGIGGGYIGEGVKTVIPAKAVCKITCRLVPRQTPERIAVLVREFCIAKAPKGVEIIVEVEEGGGVGFRSSSKNRLATAMLSAYETVFATKCRKILLGGSIPIAPELKRVSGAEPILVGVGLPGDKIHAPNEHFSLDRFQKGFLTICEGMENLWKL